MPTTTLPIPINGYSDSMNHQHGAERFATSMINVAPIDTWENRRRIGTRQGFTALADMDGGTSTDYNVQSLLNYEVYRGTDLVDEVLIVCGGKFFYADKDGNTNAIAYSTAAATATVTFTGTVTATKTIVITDTAGTSKTYTANATQTLSSRNFDCDGTVSEIATSLAACVNDTTDGHGNTITATASDGVVTLTQVQVGTATSTGNTEITGDLDNATYTNFSGACWAAGENRVLGSDTVEAVQYGNYAYLVTGRQYYKVDLSQSIPVVEEWTNYNGTGEMPSDTGGNKCSIITRFGGRIVMSGLISSSNNWFMSKIGDPDDWSPTASSNADAQAGDSSTEFGVLGEPITALFPFGDQGLMMASKNTLTYLTADPIVTGAQMIRMSNGVGVMDTKGWCQGPEKTCYVASGDGVYLLQPNQFNIQRGQSITTGRLDGFFASLSPTETSLHLAYDPSRMSIMMFVNRSADPVNVVHYQHHIPTQSWWNFSTTDLRLDIVNTTCLYSPLSGERSGLWIGCNSGRISFQPTTGVIGYDGGAHTSPFRTDTDNSPRTGSEAVFESRIAWSPINAGLSNERLLMSEAVVLLDNHDFPSPADGLTKIDPKLTIYGSDTAQKLSSSSGNIGVTETRQSIDASDAQTGRSNILEGGVGFHSSTKNRTAYLRLTVQDGDNVAHGLAELQYITLTDKAGTSKTYVITDGTTGGVATGTVLTDSNDYGSGSLGGGHALIGGIAVQINTTGTKDNAYEFLKQLEIAIEHSNGHNGTLLVNDLPASAANGPQTMTIQNTVVGTQGNTPITETLSSFVLFNDQIGGSAFIGGGLTTVAAGYDVQSNLILSVDSTSASLHGKTLIFSKVDSSSSVVTLTFDNTLSPEMSNSTTIGVSGILSPTGDLLRIAQAIKQSIDANYSDNEKSLSLVTGTPYLASSNTKAQIKLHVDKSWDGYSALPTMSGTSVSNNFIDDSAGTGGSSITFTNSGWMQFVDGGRSARVGGTFASPTSETEYSLDDVSVSSTLKTWSLSNLYNVRKSGNRTTGSDPDQYEGIWGVFDKISGLPMYIAGKSTATLALSKLYTTEILPSFVSDSYGEIDPKQETREKKELQSWTLNAGRNNRLRMRQRESDFQVQISASGTAWILEDIAVTVDAGGKYRGLVS